MTSNQNRKLKIKNILLPWLDVLAITAWGILIIRYWLTERLNLLIHPDYFWLVILGAIGFLIVGVFKAVQLWQTRQRYEVPNVQHISLFPPGWGSALLLTTSVLGFIITPQVFASQTALDRGVTELIGATRTQPQAFRATVKPEERSLIDWVRTLNVYPEPDAYTGQKVKVQGFVIHAPEMDKNHLFLARFVITCCAADVYPVGLPVKLSENRDQFPPDTWLEVEGQMVTEIVLGKRQLTIAANTLKKIPQPKNPYSY
ncbi:TIGR03943 family protein [Cronbergia sp. UHCC 0137]|uniref:TIGR03943 family putative permease subunit n=1 Tax=Cronbergia sp. UHCC 0137 TaxID=3110239 RepID=UPI002B20B3CE|nr:TIGR03943 family protein [Cronbergia sp. UHCC 0137]MEA5616950.1 TIGR03943 family protein [Cronbergia sp. UHCC 0137]